MTLRSMLRPVLGRERTIWRALPWPRPRHRLFRDDIDCVIFALLVSLRHVFFIQIGSHDGRTGDPVWTFRRHPHLSPIALNLRWEDSVDGPPGR